MIADGKALWLDAAQARFFLVPDDAPLPDGAFVIRTVLGRRRDVDEAALAPFEIARADLRLRGMGNLFGEEQSGELTFRIADPVRDEELNVQARAAAERLLERDPDLTAKENAGLLRILSGRYSRALELFRVG